MPSRQTSSFTTLSPDNQTTVNLNTVAGFSLVDGNTYGVGTVVMAYFDDPITDKSRRREAPARHHQPARRRILELGQRPRSPLATREVLRARHFRRRHRRHLRREPRRRHVRRGEPARLVQDRELARVHRRRHDQTGQRVRQRQAGPDHADLDGHGRHRDRSAAGPFTSGHRRASTPCWTRPTRWSWTPRPTGSTGSGGYRDDRPVRHPHQHGRHLSAPAELHRVGAGQHQRVPRLPQPQRRQRRDGSSTSPSPATSSRSTTPAAPRSPSRRAATGPCRGTSGARAAR